MNMPGKSLDRLVLVASAALLALIFALNAMQLQRGVQVLAAAPADTTVSNAARITVTFSEEMDHDSVESAFSIQPDVSGTFSWTENTLIFKPELPLQQSMEYTVSVSGSALSAQSTMREAFTFSFTVRPARILYLHPADGNSQLWTAGTDPGNPEPEQLSDAEGSVVDYSTARDGSIIIYIEQFTGGRSIQSLDPASGKIRMLVDCRGAACLYPALSPDGKTLAYFREEGDPSDSSVEQGLWIMDLESGSISLLAPADPSRCDAPSWSPDGDMLAWADADAGGIRIRNMNSGQEQLIPSSMGISGSWSEDGTEYLFSELQMAGSQPRGVIYTADLEQKSISLLFGSGGSGLSFRVPQYSPDGKWMAAAVSGPDTGPGYQLVLYSFPDITPHIVTNEPDFTFSSAAWHPASNAFLYQRVDNLDPSAPPSIWLYDLDSENSTLLIENAYNPGWLH